MIVRMSAPLPATAIPPTPSVQHPTLQPYLSIPASGNHIAFLGALHDHYRSLPVDVLANIALHSEYTRHQQQIVQVSNLLQAEEQLIGAASQLSVSTNKLPELKVLKKQVGALNELLQKQQERLDTTNPMNVDINSLEYKDVLSSELASCYKMSAKRMIARFVVCQSSKSRSLLEYQTGMAVLRHESIRELILTNLMQGKQSSNASLSEQRRALAIQKNESILVEQEAKDERKRIIASHPTANPFVVAAQKQLANTASTYQMIKPTAYGGDRFVSHFVTGSPFVTPPLQLTFEEQRADRQNREEEEAIFDVESLGLDDTESDDDDYEDKK